MSGEYLAQLEQSVIGAVLLRPENLALLPTLETGHFSSVLAQTAWSAIRNLEARHQPIDAATVGDEIARSYMAVNERPGDRDEYAARHFAYLGECVLRVPTIENAIEYARRVKDYALRRRLSSLFANMAEAEQRGDMSGADLLTMALASLSSMDSEQPEDANTIGQIVQARIREIERLEEERRNGSRTINGFPTGIAKLDEKLGGWQPGIVSIIAARPAMGKSSLGLATADACSERGDGVHVFSLEDTRAAYADRGMSRESRVPAEDIRNCHLNRGQMNDLQDALRKLGRRRSWLFDDRSGITADEIVRSVRRRKRDNKTKVVIVDYIQLVKKPNPRMSVHESLGEIITTFADAAKHDGLAYVVMSQLNREIEKRDDKRPLLSDLRESGSLEERSKCVVGVYRGHQYKLPPKQGVDYDCDCQKQDRCTHAPSDEEFAKQVQLHILKNSNGRTGKITATWSGPTTRMD